jgi:hypothetical protein
MGSKTQFQGALMQGNIAKPEASRTQFLLAHYGASPPPDFPTTKEGFGGGFFMTPWHLAFAFAPLTLGAANIVASQSPGAGAITLAAAAGTTLVSVNGQSRIRLDCPRALTITSGGDDTGITFTITGYDVYGTPLVESGAGANAGAKSFNKAFYEISGITHTGSVATTVTAGTRDVIGCFPARSDFFDLTQIWYNNLPVTVATGYVAAVTTDPATATTGDVRGTYALQTAANGARRLVVWQALIQLGGTAKQQYGIDQFGG